MGDGQNKSNGGSIFLKNPYNSEYSYGYDDPINPKPKINGHRVAIIEFLGEFFGTAYFIFMGVGGAVSISTASKDNPLPNLAVPFAFGFSLFMSIYIWAPVSGGVLNPAVTIGLMAVNKMELIRGILYIVAEFLGGIVGALFISLVQPGPAGGATVLSDDISVPAALFLEMFTTSVLVMAVLMFVPGKHGHGMGPFGIGMSLFISALCAGPYTGASLNPARTLGPAIIANTYGRAHWIYYVGPALGGLLASAYYNLLNVLNYTQAKNCDPCKAEYEKTNKNGKLNTTGVKGDEENLS